MQMPDAVERGRVDEEQMHQVAMVGHDAVHDFELQPNLVVRRWANREALAIDDSQRKLGRFEYLCNRRIVLRVGVPPYQCEIEDRGDDDCGYRHRAPSATR